ncbi:MAG: RsmD family RNA methyltransferase [Polyangiales bacterium]
MRIVGGRLSGRRLASPGGRGTRPTSDRVREALGSALQARDAFDGARVLDLFAGTGALSFEALSRGAASSLLVERDANALRRIKQSAAELGIAAKARTIRLDLLGDPESVIQKIPKTGSGFSLVFADAPYAAIDSIPPILEALAVHGRLAPGAWIVVERPVSYEWAWPNHLAPDADYRYGQTGISLGVYPAGKGTQ